MRISTASAFDTGIATLQQRQGELNAAQQQLTSGKRISRLSDDPVAAARAERARAAQARADADQRGVDASRAIVAQVESALGDAGDLVQQARELLVAAGNSSYGPGERQGIARQLAAIRSQLLQVANRGDGAGGWLFSGQGVAAEPFVDAPGGVTYAATSGTTHTASSEPLPLAADGRGAFLEARSGNGVFVTAASGVAGSAWIDAGGVTDPSQITGLPYSVQFSVGGAGSTFTVLRNGAATALTNVPYVSGQAIQIDGMAFTITGAPANGDNFTITPSGPTLSVFDALDQAVAALGNPGLSAGALAQTVADGLRDVDAAAMQLNGARADAGSWLQRLDNVQQRVGDHKLLAQTEQSNAEDLDMVHAISDFQLKQTGYDAALRAYSMVQRLSLFDYLP
ncbi:MAG: flagellar hook-associated protein FlgL [Burkholderiaceae bacterium]|nr:MAG: flagellar hook-associated protein 3 [Burkholderiaceae bacterium]MBE7426355.1 flagellar hook-associated protein FlgL [Ideonella sp.]MCC7286263.1 flagellar hook-associated protein FlgL [Burkholderiaceae bacterium]